MTKTRYYFIFILTLLIIFISGCTSKETEVAPHDIFENQLGSFTLSDEQKRNINLYLSEYYVETESVVGFSKYEPIYDLSVIDSCLYLAINSNDTSLYNNIYNSVYDKLKNYKADQIENCISLYNYFSIATKLNLPIKNEFYQLLDKYFDDETSLFFYNGKGDVEVMKLSITINLYSILKNDEVFISKYSKSIKSKIEEMYANYKFLEPSSNSSLYNAGGRIIIAANVILDKVDFSDKINWYNNWKQSLRTITDYFSALAYCDFLDIMVLFEDVDVSKLDTYLSSLKTIDLNSELDLVSRVAKYVNVNKYSFYTNLDLVEFVSSIKVVKTNIDIENTYYGYILALNSGFAIDNTKMKSLVNKYYELISQEQSIDKLSHFIYYTVSLDVCINKTISCNIDMLQEKITYIIENMPRSIDLRKAFEAMSLVSLYKSIKVSSKNVDKIKEDINKILDDKTSLTNYLVTDLLLIDYDINGVFKDDKFDELKNNLYCDGGYKLDSSDSKANIVSTYLIYRLNILSNNKTHIDENKEYVKHLEVKDGIYSYSLSDSSVDLGSILFGNIIANAN